MLAKCSYYAPLPMLTMDAEGQIIDFNVALQVLIGADIEGCRYQPAQLLLQRTRPRIEGTLLPAPGGYSAGNDYRKGMSGEFATAEANAAKCRYRSENFGSVDLRRTAISHVDLSTGDVSGTTVYWEILRIEREGAFRDSLRREWTHQLTWETYAISYDHVLPHLPFYQEVVARHVEAMSAPEITDVIDVGAGTGNVTVPLLKAGRCVTAVDLSRAMLDKLRAKLPEEHLSIVTIVEQNAEHLPQWENESFDGVNILLALYDMARPLSALSEAVRVLRPGGRLVITEPKHCFDMQTLLDFAEKFLRDHGLYESLSTDWDRVIHANKVLDPSGRSPLRAEDIKERLCDAGFDDVTMEDSHLGNCATVQGRKPRRTRRTNESTQVRQPQTNPSHFQRTLSSVRAARAADGPAISALYREAYTPPDGGDARRHYPFPQFLDPDWVADAVTRDNIRWLVADFEGEVVGTMGAVLQIGSVHDRVVEGFGLVVSEKLRGRGIGTDLLNFLCKTLDGDALFMIAETRTADAGGWKIVRRCGFVPLGFEPFAHATPAGAESMLLTGKMWENASARRAVSGRTTSSVHRLARPVLNSLHLEPLSVALQTQDMVHNGPWKQIRRQLIPAHPAVQIPALESVGEQQTFQVVRDDFAGAKFLQEWNPVDPHASGVVSLRRLEGEDHTGDRYDRQYLVGRVGPYPVACARLVRDRLDRRVRILAFQTLFQGLQGIMFRRILEELERESAGNPLTVVVDARADIPELLATLEKLGFFPTAYYPSLIMTKSGRVDAVQYTRLYYLRFEDSLKLVSDLDWSSAKEVISRVARSAGN